MMSEERRRHFIVDYSVVTIKTLIEVADATGEDRNTLLKEFADVLKASIESADFSKYKREVIDGKTPASRI